MKAIIENKENVDPIRPVVFVHLDGTDTDTTDTDNTLFQIERELRLQEFEFLIHNSKVFWLLHYPFIRVTFMYAYIYICRTLNSTLGII